MQKWGAACIITAVFRVLTKVQRSYQSHEQMGINIFVMLRNVMLTKLFSIVTPDFGLIQAEQYSPILLTNRNNVGSKRLKN